MNQLGWIQWIDKLNLVTGLFCLRCALNIRLKMNQVWGIDFLTEKIFDFLRAKDLKNVRLVCRRWEMVASGILAKRRTGMFCLSIMEQANGSEYLVSESSFIPSIHTHLLIYYSGSSIQWR